MMDKRRKEERLLWHPNTKVDVFGKIEKKNELGETYHEFSKVDSMWAEVIPQTGKLQTQQNDTVLANVSHKIKVRYQAGKNINRDMYLIVRGERFGIKYILNPYNKNEFLEIFCEQVVE